LHFPFTITFDVWRRINLVYCTFFPLAYRSVWGFAGYQIAAIMKRHFA
jgi:hypothetical protein